MIWKTKQLEVQVYCDCVKDIAGKEMDTKGKWNKTRSLCYYYDTMIKLLYTRSRALELLLIVLLIHRYFVGQYGNKGGIPINSTLTLGTSSFGFFND